MEIQSVNEEVIDKRAIGAIENDVIYTNSIELYRVKFNPMTKLVDFILLQ